MDKEKLDGLFVILGNVPELCYLDKSGLTTVRAILDEIDKQMSRNEESEKTALLGIHRDIVEAKRKHTGVRKKPKT